MLIEIIALVFLLFFALYNLQMLWRRFTFPPGPFPLPLIGNLYQLDPVMPHVTMKKWSQIYGPVFTVWMGIKPAVVITDYKLMEEATITNGDRLKSRPKMFVPESLVNGRFGITMTDGKAWKEQRRFALHTLRNFGLGRSLMEKRILFEAERLSASIREDMGSEKEIVLDLSTSIHLCVVNIISSIIFGRTFEKGDEQCEHLKETADKISIIFSSFKILLVNSFPWLRHVPLFGHFNMDKLSRLDGIMRVFFMGEVEKHKRALEENKNLDDKPSDFMDAYLKEMKRRQREGVDTGYFNEWQLWIIATELWMTSTDNTMTSFRWAILAMVKYQRVQQKVHHEIDAVLGRDRMPTMADRQSMPYVMATLEEVYRWGNIIHINFTHSSDNDFQLGGFKISKGTNVIPQIANLAIDEKAFPSPEQFHPERHLEDDGKTLRNAPFEPFGMGKRRCPGEGMARTQMFLLLIDFLRQFSVSPVPDEDEPGTESSTARLTFAMDNFKCLVTLR